MYFSCLPCSSVIVRLCVCFFFNKGIALYLLGHGGTWTFYPLPLPPPCLYVACFFMRNPSPPIVPNYHTPLGLQAFNKYKNKLTESQSVANRPLLQESFTKLLADVQRNLESTNRDRFTQRLTSFRISVRQFLTM